MAPTVDSVVGYLAALAGGHPVLVERRPPGATRGAGRALRPGRHPAADGRRGGPRRAPGAAAATSCTPIWRCCCPRPAPPARRALVRLSHANVLANADRDRRVPRPHRRRSGDHLAPPALLLRAVGAAQPPRAGRRHGAHRPVRGGRLLLGRLPHPRGHEPRRGAVHVRAPRPGGLRPHAPRHACGSSPRPAGASPPSTSAGWPSRASATGGTSS